MFEACSKAQVKRTLLLVVICGVLTAAASAVGISDDPAGGSLAFLSGIALVLTFVHPWRTTRRFLLMVGASVVAFVAIVVVGGLIDSAGVEMGAVGDFLFYIAIFLCPAGSESLSDVQGLERPQGWQVAEKREALVRLTLWREQQRRATAWGHRREARDSEGPDT